MKLDLGMDMEPVNIPEASVPEDTEPLPVWVRFSEGTRWYHTTLLRGHITSILAGGINTIDGIPIVDLCIHQHEGTECNIMYVFHLPTKEWRLE